MREGLAIFFRTRRACYLYEAYGNGIYQIPELPYRIFPLLLRGEIPAHIRSRFRHRFSARAIDQFFRKGSRRGIYGALLKTPSPVRSVNPLDERSTWHALAQRLQHLQLELTENCNLRCKYCILSDLYPTEKNYSAAVMSWETAQKAIDFFHAHTGKTKDPIISFYGGEPLLQFPLIQRAVSYARQIFSGRPIRFGMTTNGTLLNEHTGKYLIQQDFDLIISLDGPQNVHDRFRVFPNGNGSFHKVLTAVQVLRNINPAYFEKKVRFNAVKAPPYRFKETEKFFNQLAIPGNRVLHSFVRLENTDFFDRHPESDPDRDAFSRLVSEFVRERQTAGSSEPEGFYAPRLLQRRFLLIHKRTRDALTSRPRFLTAQCLPGVKRLFVAVNGDFHVCERVEHSCPIGNVTAGFNREKIHRFFDDYFDDAAKACTRCWALRFCDVCAAKTIRDGRFCVENKLRHCRLHRRWTKRNLKRYCSILEKNPKAFDYMDSLKVI